MNKLATALGCLMMLGMAIAPVAFAHGDTGNHAETVNLGAVTPAGWAAAGSGKVAGFYYGSASAWLQVNSAALPVPGCPAPTGDATVDGILCGLDPSFTLATAYGLCDAEVLGDGTAPFELDETSVDGIDYNNGVAPEGPNSLPDGLFNDGGIGAVCHTPDSHYSYGDYNTNGCSGTAVNAFASDLVVGGDLWISTSCDSTTPGTTTPLLTQVLSFSTCATNEVLSGNIPGGVVNCVNVLGGCAVGAPFPACPSGSGPLFCVPDGVSDAGSNGYGSAGVPYAAKNAICAAGTDSSEAVFVWNAVEVTVPPAGGPSVNTLSVATHGWVA